MGGFVAIDFLRKLISKFSRKGAWHGRPCLLYTSDAADERSSVDLGGRRIIKKKKQNKSELQHDHRIM